MKLSAKFARQETEEQRLARIARKRVRADRADAIRRMFGETTTRAPGRRQRTTGRRTSAA